MHNGKKEKKQAKKEKVLCPFPKEDARKRKKGVGQREDQ